MQAAAPGAAARRVRRPGLPRRGAGRARPGRGLAPGGLVDRRRRRRRRLRRLQRVAQGAGGGAAALARPRVAPGGRHGQGAPARPLGWWPLRLGMRARASGLGRACECRDGAALRSDPRARARALRGGRRRRCAPLVGGAHGSHQRSGMNGRACRGRPVACLHHGRRARRVLQRRPRPKRTRPQADLP